MFASPWKDGLIILVILLLFFGPKRLPALSRAIGESVREFKGGIADAARSDEQKSEISSAPVSEQPRSAEQPQETTVAGGQSRDA